VSTAREQRAGERSRAARLARHYREQERLPVKEIARLLGRAPTTITAYLHDPDATKTKAIRRRYRGNCRKCGEPTWGAGPRAAASLCARCNGAATRKWQPEQIEAALRAWNEMYGKPASSTDLSLTHATRARDGGVRLRRLKAGWSGGVFPPASVVQYNYGTVAHANHIALAQTP
jgi:hypothetical protein